MQIKSKEASQFTYIYVCIKKKTNRSKTKPNAENTHFGKIAFNQIDYKKTINQEYFTSKSNGHFWLWISSMNKNNHKYFDNELLQ